MAESRSRLKTQRDDDLAEAVGRLVDSDEYEKKSEAVTELAKTGLRHRRYRNELVTDWLLFVALGSAITSMLLFGVAYAGVVSMPAIVPLTAAAVAFVANIAYAVQLRTVLKVLNGGA